MNSSAETQKDLRIKIYNIQPKAIGVDTIILENNLALLAPCKIIPIENLNQLKASPCDLLIIGATSLNEDSFYTWFKTLSKKMHQQNNIWIPAIIFSNVPFGALNEMLSASQKMNWYFDILHPQHVSSLPIRVANLLRIHDHLHELDRYQSQIESLHLEVDTLSKKLENM